MCRSSGRASMATRQILSDAEFTQRQSQSERQLQSDNSDFDVETADRSNAGQVGSATSPPPHWLERRKISRRTSLVIDPPDGRVPPLTREAQARANAGAGIRREGRRSAAGPEPVGALHRPRDAERDLPDGLQRQRADRAGARRSRDHLRDDSRHAHHPHRRLTARRARASAATSAIRGDVGRGTRWSLTSRTSVTRPTIAARARRCVWSNASSASATVCATKSPPRTRHTWTAPWTAALDLEPQPDGMFEYACHEGNNSMRNILSGARAAER